MPASLPASPKRALSRRFLRYFAGIAGFVVVAFAGMAGWCYLEMRGSLAQLDGESGMPGASAPIVIERDALGIPTIRASSRADVARGLGFLHAQDRFFQMNLSRRRAAGELSELFGSAAVAIDTRTRMLRLRARASSTIDSAAPDERAVLVAWGFTNSTGDWSDLVILEPDPVDAGRYRTPSGMLSISTVREMIKVKGSASVPVEVRETIWGPGMTIARH